MIKGLLSGLFGILIGCIGIDIFNGAPRFGFGNINLESGIQLVPAMIGLFLPFSGDDRGGGYRQGEEQDPARQRRKAPRRAPARRQGICQIDPHDLRSSVIGVLVGILPGAGGDIGSWLSYNVAKKTSRHPEKFGRGSLEGIAASEAANNAVTGGALIPMLTLGIPGSGVTAILLGGLMIKGMQPATGSSASRARSLTASSWAFWPPTSSWDLSAC